MVVAEPSTFGGLWPQVRAITGWPQANEEIVTALAGDWVGAGERFAAAGDYPMASLPWTDGPGQAFVSRATQTLGTAKESATGMGRLAQRAADYAGHVINAKTYIQQTVNKNIPKYVLAGLLPPGVAQAVQHNFVNTLATDITGHLTKTAAQIAQGLPPPPPEPLPDEGAGPYASQPATLNDHLEAAKQRAIALGGQLTGKPDAARHLNHYLDNTGEDLVVDPDKIAREVPSFQQKASEQATAEINRIAQEAAAKGQFGQPVPFTTDWDGHYLAKGENENWYYAMGGIQHSTTGTVTVLPPDTPGGQPRVVADYQTHVWDRYNWDSGKSVQINGEVVPDDNQGKLHRAGIAKEYDITGTSGVHNYQGTVPPG